MSFYNHQYISIFANFMTITNVTDSENQNLKRKEMQPATYPAWKMQVGAHQTKTLCNDGVKSVIHKV